MADIPLDDESATITLLMPRDEARAFARFLARCSYVDCVVRGHRVQRRPDGRDEVDLMWAALRMVQDGFAAAGFAPR